MNVRRMNESLYLSIINIYTYLKKGWYAIPTEDAESYKEICLFSSRLYKF